MAKRPKLFYAFNGDAIGLRNVLVEHLKEMQQDAHMNIHGSSYADGLKAGEHFAYGQVVSFLKRLVINNDELPDPTGDVNTSERSE